MTLDDLREMRIRVYRDMEGNFRVSVLGVDWMDCAAVEVDVLCGAGTLLEIELLLKAMVEHQGTDQWLN
jgi:hypothetical protein